MKKKFIFSLFAIITVHLSSFSQEYSIIGKVVDSINPIEFSNVIIKDQNDKIVEGTTTGEQGIFKLKAQEGTYTLTISFLGYEDWSKEIMIDQNQDLGIITLSESKSQLGEVIVVAKKPIIEKKVDRLVFNVENSIAASGGNALDALRKTPGVIVSSNGGLQILSKGGTQVMINDEIIQLSQEEVKDMLESMSAENIASIEVITTPPAKYDAEGSGLINIRLSKNNNLGYKGSINSSYTQGIMPKFNNGTSFFYKSNKISISTNYSLVNGIRAGRDESRIKYINEETNTFSSIWDETSKIETRFLTHNYRFSVDYQVLEKLLVSFKTSGNITPKSDNETNSKTYVSNNLNALDSVFSNRNTTEGNIKNLSYNLSLIKNFKKEGHNLSFDANFINYHNDKDQKINTRFFDNNEVFLRDEAFALSNDQKIRINSYILHPV